jgi:hypothetical protein
MKSYYISIHKLKLFILLVFLEGCGGFSNTPIFQTKTAELANIHDGPTNSITIKHLVGKELVAHGGHLITFYQEEGQLKAEVRINASVAKYSTRSLGIRTCQYTPSHAHH